MTRERTTLPAPPNGSNLRTMIGAVIYVRVSTKEQTENLSLPTQVRAYEDTVGAKVTRSDAVPPRFITLVTPNAR